MSDGTPHKKIDTRWDTPVFDIADERWVCKHLDTEDKVFYDPENDTFTCFPCYEIPGEPIRLIFMELSFP